MDFRGIEQELVRFFRSEGVKAHRLDGDVYIGVVQTRVDIKRGDGGGTISEISFPNQPTMAIVSLTRLARELAEAAA